jgi:hypothetical protein
MELIKVVDAKYLEGYKIEFRFSNGITKVVDLTNEIYGEVFEPLKDKNYFKNFTLNPFTIEWENGADFSPEFLFRLGQ